MNKLTRLAALLLLLALNACTSTNKSVFKPVTLETDKVAVYLYRPTVMANAMYSPELYINDEFKLAIKSGSNTRIVLPAGEYIFEIEPNKQYKGVTRLKLNLTSGSHFIRVDSKLKLNQAASYQPYQRSFNLISVNENLAVTQISDCCTKQTKNNHRQSEVISNNDEPNDSFSVDKTQNPFSH